MELYKAINLIGNYIEDCYEQPLLQGQHLSGLGAISGLEEKLREFYDKKYAITFYNATTALQAVCIAQKLHGYEIIAPPLNWGGSIAPFLLHKNKLCFTAFDPETFNLDVSDLPFVLSPETKAVLSVDFGGIPADSKSIKAFCQEHDLFYISDCAQSFGAYRDDKPGGYWADAIVLSFSPLKTLMGFEGGAVITNNRNLYEKLLWYSQHPSRQKTIWGLSNYNEYLPINGRLNPLSAILLNETFDLALNTLKNYQIKFFKVIQELVDLQMIKEVLYIPTPEASTFYNLSLQPKPRITEEKINNLLKQRNYPFISKQVEPRLIPFDVSFRDQFQGCFFYSENLLNQQPFTAKRIVINHIEEI